MSGLAKDGRMNLPALDEEDFEFNVAGPGITFSGAGMAIPVVGWILAGITVVGTAGEWLITQDENRKIREAARLASSNLLKGDELFEASKRICSAKLEAALPAITGYKKAAATLLEQVHLTSDLFETQAQIISRRVGRKLLVGRLNHTDLGRSIRDDALRLQVEEQLESRRQWKLRYRILSAAAIDAGESVLQATSHEERLASCVRARMAAEDVEDFVVHSGLTEADFTPAERKQQADSNSEIQELLVSGGCRP
jgi:hypothetical protein